MPDPMNAPENAVYDAVSEALVDRRLEPRDVAAAIAHAFSDASKIEQGAGRECDPARAAQLLRISTTIDPRRTA